MVTRPLAIFFSISIIFYLTHRSNSSRTIKESDPIQKERGESKEANIHIEMEKMNSQDPKEMSDQVVEGAPIKEIDTNIGSKNVSDGDTAVTAGDTAVTAGDPAVTAGDTAVTAGDTAVTADAIDF